MARVVVDRQDVTVDIIAWRHFGRPDGALVAQILALNPGLADKGLILPIGTELDLPEERPQIVRLRETVRLWD